MINRIEVVEPMAQLGSIFGGGGGTTGRDNNNVASAQDKKQSSDIFCQNKNDLTESV